jgi:hypothetical protein
MKMNKRGLIKMGVTGILVTAVFVLSFMVLSSFNSSAVLVKDTYALDEPVRIDLGGFFDYTVKITTPSTSFVRRGSNDVFIFKPENPGTHEILVDVQGEVKSYKFNVIGEKVQEKEEIFESRIPNRFDDGKERERIGSLSDERKISVNVVEENRGFVRTVMGIPKMMFSSEEKHFLTRGAEKIESDIIVTEEEGELIVTFDSKKGMKPGVYTLRTEHKGQTIQKEFAWGLISLNTRKSIYRPSERAEFIIVVLDREGRPVCEADIRMNVVSPSGEKTYFDMKDIRPNIECGLYDASHIVKEEGRYEIGIETALEDNIIEFETFFLVKEEYDYEIIRHADSKIDPTLFEKFDVSIEIEALNGKNFLEIR